MAHFYGTVQGSRGAASRTGGKSGHMTAHIRTWGFGVRTTIKNVDGKDIVQVYKTSGSGGQGKDTLVAEFTKEGSEE